MAQTRILFLTASAAAVLVNLYALPSANADWRRGHRLAQQWCAGCHQVEPGGPMNEVAPSFAEIAQRQLSTNAVEAWLSTGHPRMPDLHLSRAEIDVITEYLANLEHVTIEEQQQ